MNTRDEVLYSEYRLERPAMTESVEEPHTPSSPYPSGSSSMESSFQIVSRESVDFENDSATGNNAAPEHILLTPLAEGSAAETEDGDTELPAPSSMPPVAKPRTLHMHTIASDPAMATPTPSTAGHLSGPFSSVEGRVTPPTPRPRPRSAEQKKQEQEMRQKVNKLERELEEAGSKIARLESGRREMEALKKTLKETEMENTELKGRVRQRETEQRNTEGLLKKRASRIAGLQEEVNILKQPYDPKRRLEVRLSESIGKNKELEEELSLLRTEREEYKLDLAREKGELEGEVERERERHRQEIEALQTEVARLQTEKMHIERDELQQATEVREGLEREVGGLTERVREVQSELQLERERARLAEEGRERIQTELQGQLQVQRQESENLKDKLAAQHRQQCGSLERSLVVAQEQCSQAKLQLAAATSARESAELALKKEQTVSGKLRQDCAELKQTCEDYLVEINSLLKDLDEHSNSISSLQEERDKLKAQVDGLRRTFAEKQEQLKKMGEELARGQEREKRLQTQRDGLQNREEIMDLQLKQYQADFEEERKAREEIAKVVRHLQTRDKDSGSQIAQLRKQINELSTEKNDLAFQLEQLRAQLPQQQQ